MSADNESAADPATDDAELLDNYDDLTVDDVLDIASDWDDDELRDLLAYEEQRKDRVGVTRELRDWLDTDDTDASDDDDTDAADAADADADDDDTDASDADDDAERLGKFMDDTNCPTCGNLMDQGHDDTGEPFATCDDCDLELNADQLIEAGDYEEGEFIDEDDTDADDSSGTSRPSKTLEDILHAHNDEWHNDRDLLFSRKQAKVVMYAIEHPDAGLSAFDASDDLPSSQYARDVLYRADPDAGAEDAAQLALARFDAEDDLEDLADDADDEEREKRERAVDEMKQYAKETRDLHNDNRHATDDDDEQDSDDDDE